MEDVDHSWDDIDAVVTLVHGTWGRGPSRVARRNPERHAPWCRDNSRFVRALDECFEGAGLNIAYSRFNWSGANSIEDRYWASERLCSQIVRVRSWGKPHLIIGHSHGGNVALEALELYCKRGHEEPPALATMATPFLFMEKVPHRRDFWLAGPVEFLCLAGLAYWLLISPLSALFAGLPFLAVPVAIMGLALAGVCTILLGTPPKNTWKWNACSRVWDPGTNLLVLRGTEDEAGFALTLSLLAIRLTDLIAIVYTLARALIDLIAILCFIIIPMTLAGAFAFDIVLGGDRAHSGWIVTQLRALLPLAGTIAFCIGLVVAIRLIIPALAKASFGWELIRGPGALSVSANSVPDGCANLTVRTLSRAQHRSLLSLHSLHDHREAAPAIAEWAAGLWIGDRGVRQSPGEP